MPYYSVKWRTTTRRLPARGTNWFKAEGVEDAIRQAKMEVGQAWSTETDHILIEAVDHEGTTLPA